MDLLQYPLFSSLTIGSIFNTTAFIAQPLMHSFSLLIAGTLAVQAILAAPGPSRIARDPNVIKRAADTFLATESPIALNRLICNIGSSGACVSGAGSGLVIASPSKTNPDCQYLVFWKESTRT
jgi:glucoamylase